MRRYLKNEIIMYSSTMTQSVYLDVPVADWTLLQGLINRFGWKSETREDMLRDFLQTRPYVSDLTEEDIMNEVRSVRYAS